MSIVHAETERTFNPHLLLLQGAKCHLERSKEREEGFYYDWLAAIVFSALSIEAIGNSYGSVLVADWKDFESANPIAKLRLVAARCGIQPDFSKAPWETARRLKKFRDRIAHAKRQHLKLEKDCDETNYGQVFGEKLESDVETMITEAFACQACDAIEQIRTALNKNLTESELHEVNFGGREWSAEILNNKVT